MTKIRMSYFVGGVIAVGIVLAVLFLFGPTGTGDLTEPDATTLIARVNGEDITLMQVRARQRQLVGATAEGGEVLTEEQAFGHAIDDLLIETLLYQDAVSRDIVADKAVVEARYNSARDNYDSEKAFEDRLAVNFLTKEQFRENLRRQFVLGLYFEELAREEVLGTGDNVVEETTETGTTIRIGVETDLSGGDTNQLAQKRFLELAPLADIEVFIE